MSLRILQSNTHDAENRFEISLREAFELLKPQLKPPFPLTIPSPLEYSKLNQAILFGILTQPQLAKIHITHLHAIVTDGYGLFVSLVLKIVFELYPKLIELVKIQLIWVSSKLVEVSAVGVDSLLIGLMRQIVGGDFSDGNLWLCVELLRIFLSNWDWLLEEPLLLTSALFTYLRLLGDHYRLLDSKFEALKRMEIDFCVTVLRNHFNLSLRIGRDLVRLLQDLVYIPEFKAIWKDLLLNPSEFKVQGFTDISQLYSSRTSSKYLLLRITPEMEMQLRFLLTHVKWGFQNRYQTWFARKFLCRPEAESVITDIVRFICCAHHPPNEVIQSNVIPRWAIIGWLLKCCRNSHVEANTKLALLFDWMFFSERVDNIMNIEPAILLMVNSIPKYIDMTQNILEFLFQLVENYDMQRKEVLVKGVSTAFDVLVRKGVVPSLEALSLCTLLSPLLRKKFSYISSNSALAVHLPHCSAPPPPKLSSPSSLEMQMSVSTKLTPNSPPKETGVSTSAPVINTPVAPCSPKDIPVRSPIDIMEDLVQRLGEFIKRSIDLGLQILEEILLSFARHDSQSLDAAALASSVLHPEVLACQVTEAFTSNGYEVFPSLKSPTKFDYDNEIQSAATLVICTFIFCQDKRMQELITFWSKNGYLVGPRFLSYASRLAHEANMISGLRTLKRENSITVTSDPEIPLLKHHIDKYSSFMSARGEGSPGVVYIDFNNDSKLIVELVQGAFASYKTFLRLSSLSHKENNTSLAKFLFSDLTSCCQFEKKRFKELLCDVFRYLPDLSTGREEFVLLLVETLDYADLVVLQFDICLQRFSIFSEDTDTISRMVKKSCSWGLVEQQKFWALMEYDQVILKVRMEKVVKDFFCLGLLDPVVHSIAIAGLLTLCSRHAPTPELVSRIMSLPDDNFEGFAASVLANWVASNGLMLFNSLAKCLEKIDNDGNLVFFIPSGGKINPLSISRFLRFLDEQGKEHTDCVTKLCTSIPEIKAKLADAAAAQIGR
ncbi:Integrator complex subunit [Thalictrum thalictroides]|uniref:Integrator complex subunit n=1 Tax=Thalictrum thalictroides TaxID=46969 RepID=A0A7J6VYH8_THATH|nr:Integrator complex subunit [Thalictrum thalictroides]